MTPAAAADRSWDRLARQYLHQRGDGRVLVKRRWLRADAWTISQIIAAGVTRAAVRKRTWPTVDGLFRGLDDHLFRDTGYTGAHLRSPGVREIYFDDNAWIGLAAVGAGLLRARSGAVHLAEIERDLWRARMVVRLLQFGEHPDGGVLWRVGGDTRNACSTGPAGILAVRVVELERRLGIASPDHGDLLAFAERCASFLRRLINEAGLVADHLRADGSVDPPVYAYNQGTAIGLQVQLARAAGPWTPPAGRPAETGASLADGTGPQHSGARAGSAPGKSADRAAAGTPATAAGTPASAAATRHLAAARSLAQAAWDFYQPGGVGTRLWRDCPVFVAILARNLLALAALDGDARWPMLVDTWRTAMEEAALDPKTGDYTRGDVGHYDNARALDRAGVCSVHWARRWPAELVPLLT